MNSRLRMLLNLFAPASILLAGVITPAEASFIRLVANTTLNADTLAVHLVNDGDEAAFNLQVQIDFAGVRRTSPPLESLPPKGGADFPFLITAPTEVGTHPIEMLVDYADANLYPFSVPLVHLLRVGAVGRPDVFGAFEPIRMAGSGRAPLHLKNQGDVARTVKVTFRGPREITIAEPATTVTLAPRSEQVIQVPLKNFSATLHSRFPLFAVMSYQSDGVQYASYARGEIETATPSRFATPTFWIGIGTVLGILLLTLLLLRVARRVRAPRVPLVTSQSGARP